MVNRRYLIVLIDRIPITGTEENVLRLAVLYGANGAGKSNLFKALAFLKLVALKPRRKGGGTGRQAFRFGDRGDLPSAFDLQFLADNRLFRYGLKADDQYIREEWLVEVKQGEQETVLFERKTQSPNETTVDVNEKVFRKSKKVGALANVDPPPNQSFLATIFAMLQPAEIGDALKTVTHWFSDGLELIGPQTTVRSLPQMLNMDPSFTQFSEALLRGSDTGVDGLDILKNELTEADIRNLVPEEHLNEVLNDLEENDTAVLKTEDEHEVWIEKKGNLHFYSMTLRSRHKNLSGTDTLLDFSEESDGTRRFLNLIPALHEVAKSPKVFFIDEIDQSLIRIITLRTAISNLLKRHCQKHVRKTSTSR